MSYSVHWLVENRVVYMRQFGVVSSDDLSLASSQATGLIAQGSAPVHVITDATDMDKLSMGLQDVISIFKNVPSDANLGWVIFISPSKLNRFFASVTTQLTGSNTREFATLEEGIAFLTRVDESLPNIALPSR